MVATGAGVAAGRVMATNVPLAAPFCLPATGLFGIAVVGDGSTGQVYTNGIVGNMMSGGSR